jgi:hypothetical protein
MADITKADADALALMPDCWFYAHSLPHMVRRADWRCERLVSLGQLERRIDDAAETLRWEYRKKAASGVNACA